MENETKNKGYLKEDERIRISNMLEKGESLSMISKALGRSKTTISNEIQNHVTSEKKGALGRRPFNDCVYRGECKGNNDCDNVKCNRGNCSGCKTGCGDGKCKTYRGEVCEKLLFPPYVCNGCNKDQNCTLLRSYYRPIVAEKEYKASRRILSLTEDLDKSMFPLIKKGLSIKMEHPELTSLSVSSIYRYINEDRFKRTGRLDLKFSCRRKKRKKKKDLVYKKDKSIKVGRRREDFDAYISSHLDTPVVEMDTVIGKKGEGKCILTLFFRSSSLQLMFLRKKTCGRYF